MMIMIISSQVILAMPKLICVANTSIISCPINKYVLFYSPDMELILRLPLYPLQQIMLPCSEVADVMVITEMRL